MFNPAYLRSWAVKLCGLKARDKNVVAPEHLYSTKIVSRAYSPQCRNSSTNPGLRLGLGWRAPSVRKVLHEYGDTS